MSTLGGDKVKKIDVKGAIVSNDEKWIYDLFDMEATSPSDITNVLKELTDETVEITINSGGGDVYSASEIYTELRDYGGDVEVRIVGIAASAASVIAMSGNVKMSPTASLMIHNAATIAMGDHREMNKTSEFLKSVNKSVSSAYQNKTGLSEDELLTLMNEETWLTADEAKAKGFIDEVMFAEQVKAVANAHGQLPQNVIDTMRDKKQEPQNITVDDIKSVVSEMKEDIIKELKIETQEEPVKNTWLF